MKLLFSQIIFGKLNRKAQPRQAPQSGQGLVEFALIIPLLLLLLVGIFELGRMLVIYSTVSAASREAARYAAAAGKNPDNNQYYYLDVTGMEAQVDRVALLAEITMDAPLYDSGPPPDGHSKTINTSLEDGGIKLGDRVTITVHSVYEPVLGLTPLSGFTINSTTSRTILKEVSIAPFGNGGGNENENEANTPPVVVITNPARTPIPVFNEGDTINFDATAEDNEDGPLTGNIIWTSSIDGQFGVGGSIDANTLSPGTHTITASVTDDAGATASDHITIEINPAPKVYILTPTSAEVEEGLPLIFTAQVDDNETGLEADVVWTDGGVQFGTGSPLTFALTGPGLHHIRACVTDSGGATGCSDELLIPVTTPSPPTIRITSPSNNARYPLDTPIVFTGEATDSKDGDLSDNIQWTSSLDGFLGAGRSVSTSTLGIGVHRITATVTDSDNRTASAFIDIEIVDDDAPVVTIELPADGAHFTVGQAITFRGSAVDNVDGNLTEGLRWSSGVDGQIGSRGTFVYSALTAVPNQPSTPHTIRAEVTDSSGLVGVATIVIYIDQHNDPPTVMIELPSTSPTVILRGRPLNFSAVANDIQEGNISSKIDWLSSRAGSLRTDVSSFSTTSLPIGMQTITATVTDSGGLSAFDTVDVDVRDFVCPTSGNITITGQNRNFADLFSWIINVPSSMIGTEYIMTSLTMDVIANPSSALVDAFSIDGANEPVVSSPAINPTEYHATESPVWRGSFSSNGTIEVVINFQSWIRRGAGTQFNLQAVFQGCETLPVQNSARP